MRNKLQEERMQGSTPEEKEGIEDCLGRVCWIVSVRKIPVVDGNSTYWRD